MSKLANIEANAIAHTDADGVRHYVDRADGPVELTDEEFARLGPDHEEKFGFPAVTAAGKDAKKAAAEGQESRSPAAPNAPLDPEGEAQLRKLATPKLLELAQQHNVDVGPDDTKQDLVRKLSEAGVGADGERRTAET